MPRIDWPWYPFCDSGYPLDPALGPKGMRVYPWPKRHGEGEDGKDAEVSSRSR